MRALDLFCGAGGASEGLRRAGFEVVGVDLEPQPRYPFTFHCADALTFPLDGYDLIWSSPPCQAYSCGAGMNGTRHLHPDLIAAVRERMPSGIPWVIENIMPAASRLRSPFMLCGAMFGLGVFRHRLFETSFPVLAPMHPRHAGRIGDGRYHTVTGHAGGSSRRDGWKGGTVKDWRRAMGIEWMTGDELAEAIPPAYSEWIALQLAQVGDLCSGR